MTAEGNTIFLPKKRYIKPGDDLAKVSTILLCNPFGVIAGAMAIKWETFRFNFSLNENAANI